MVDGRLSLQLENQLKSTDTVCFYRFPGYANVLARVNINFYKNL